MMFILMSSLVNELSCAQDIPPGLDNRGELHIRWAAMTTQIIVLESAQSVSSSLDILTPAWIGSCERVP